MQNLQRRASTIPPAVWMIAGLLLIFGTNVKNYFQIKNFTNIVIQAAPLLVIACGQTVIVLLQGTDLSVGASASMVTVLWVVFLQAGFPIVAAMLLAVLCAVLAGFMNGVVIAKGKLPPFIATLGMQNILRTVALVASNGSSIYFDHPLFKIIAKRTVWGIPISVWIAISCVAITWLMLRKTRMGTRITALGGNSEALTLAGVSVDRSIISAFVFSGLMAGIGGILLGSRIESGNPIAGNGFEFNAVAAVLLGGTSMREGRGGVVGTIFGVLLIQILKAGLNQIGVSSIYQNAIIGAVVLAAIILDAYIKRKQEE